MITISVVSHRQGRLVEALLADLERVDRSLLGAIVVTRNVPEAAIAIPPSLEPITTVVDNAQPLGFGGNHNAAFARCTTPLFAIVNPDIRLVDDPLPRLAARLEATSTAALVAPTIVAPDGRTEDAARTLITPWRLARRWILHERREPASHYEWIAGMFLLVRSDAFREVGGFDRRYFMYCEDFDLCARFRLRGWSIALANDASVVHDAQRDSHRSTKHLLWHLASLFKMWTSTAFWNYRRLLANAR